ncbi:hypothetical protein R50073_38000 [Maricurvus nonylphenolicus]
MRKPNGEIGQFYVDSYNYTSLGQLPEFSPKKLSHQREIRGYERNTDPLPHLQYL